MWLQPYIYQQGEGGMVNIKLCSSAYFCLSEEACQKHGIITSVIKPPYPITYPVLLVSLLPLRSNWYFLAAPHSWSLSLLDTHPNSLALPGACRLNPSPFVLSPIPTNVLHLHFLSSLDLPAVSFFFPLSLLRPLLGSDIKAIWWVRLSQTVHRNKVHCCLPCTMGNQLIDVYWHTEY